MYIPEKAIIPEAKLTKYLGDIATLIDFVDHPTGGEKGCVLEIFNAVGESINVITVPISAIKKLSIDDILTTRQLINT